MIRKVKNATQETRTWCGQEILSGQYYELQSSEILRWANDSVFLSVIGTGEALMNNGDIDVTDVNMAISLLKNLLPVEVTPTAPKSEYNLRPYGLGHKHIDASEQIFDITLSNKSGQDIDYSNCSATPQFYDCIFQDHSEIRDGVMSVDGSTITTFMGRLSEGAAKLSRPVNIDYKVEIVEVVYIVYLWGIYCNSEGSGEDDIMRLQVCDPDEVGVAAGLYTHEQIVAMNYIVKEYDECWVKHADKITEFNSPDGSPAQIMVGMVLRIKYYCKDPTKTDIKVWSDYKITIKDE
jgi:hypothetical protein